MSQLTDLAICKKIAEIVYKDCDRQGWDYSECGTYIVTGEGDEFNPLTDKALCFDLMVKYGLSMKKSEFSSFWLCFDFDTKNCIDYDVKGINENPQKAICLAIIAKHNKE